MLFLIATDSAPGFPTGVPDGGAFCALAMPPSNSNPAQPVEQLLCHDLQAITFPGEVNMAQAVQLAIRCIAPF
ncbi:hypothetical protein ACPPVV_07895 [Rhodanobacter sp. Col0626]|uniref:hypothetical protein n=1 Tax=Rhodanobacter sp. Col0626 TaxID=3415679 RepID=UPI003CEEEAB9